MIKKVDPSKIDVADSRVIPMSVWDRLQKISDLQVPTISVAKFSKTGPTSTSTNSIANNYAYYM